jgi:hypothetical protein
LQITFAVTCYYLVGYGFFNIFNLNAIGSPVELVRAFGKKKDFEKALKELEIQLYKNIG